MFELGKLVDVVQSSIGGHKVEPKTRPFLRDGGCLTRGSGEPENGRLVGTVGGGRIKFGDPRPFRMVEDVASSRPGRITASARRDRLNAQLIRCGQPPLPPLARWSP